MMDRVGDFDRSAQFWDITGHSYRHGCKQDEGKDRSQHLEQGTRSNKVLTSRRSWDDSHKTRTSRLPRDLKRHVQFAPE